MKLKLNGLQLNGNAKTGVTVDIAMIAKIAPSIRYILVHHTRYSTLLSYGPLLLVLTSCKSQHAVMQYSWVDIEVSFVSKPFIDSLHMSFALVVYEHILYLQTP